MRPEKKAIAEEVRGRLESAGFAIMVDYRGLSVEQISDLRGRLREANARLQVVGNVFLSRAAADLGRELHDGILDGPTAMVSGDSDVTVVAKVLKDFAKGSDLPVVKGGLLGKKAFSAADVDVMASLPSREVMLARLVGTVAAPMTQLVGVMNQKLCSLLYVLKAIADKESGE